MGQMVSIPSLRFSFVILQCIMAASEGFVGFV